MKRLTQKQYAKQGGCPFCGSDQIQGAEINMEGLECWQEISCTDCGREWYDIYELKRYEEIVRATVAV